MDQVTQLEFEQIKERIIHLEKELLTCSNTVKEKRCQWSINYNKLLLERYQNAIPPTPRSEKRRKLHKIVNANKIQKAIVMNLKQIEDLSKKINEYSSQNPTEKHRFKNFVSINVAILKRKISELEIENRCLATMEPTGLSETEIMQLTEYKLPLPIKFPFPRIKKASFWDDTVSESQKKRVAIWIIDKEGIWKYLKYELASCT